MYFSDFMIACLTKNRGWASQQDKNREACDAEYLR